MGFNPADFVVEEPKSIPVLLLLDTSGSMSGNNIDNLNKAVKTMIESFKNAETMETYIKLSIITFGIEINLHTELTEVSKINFQPLSAAGATPMGAAFKMAKAMIEDQTIFKSRDYRPTIILLSDGEPTDDWKTPLNDFINNGRSSKCDRMAISIGGIGREPLDKFIEGCTNPLFFAEDAAKLIDEFKKITMSVTLRTRTINKNQIIEINNILDGKDINEMTFDDFKV